MSTKITPYFTCGVVVRGFGRGSKQLGTPTANFGPEVIEHLPSQFDTGVYFGWARVNNGDVHKMVTSIGWNPVFKNEQKSMETYIMHEFKNDFYGEHLRVCLLGYLRPQTNFESIDELITAIQKDIADAEKELDNEELKTFKTHAFFSEANNSKK